MPRPSQLLVVCAVALLGLAIVFVHSASFRLQPVDGTALGSSDVDPRTQWPPRHLIYAGLAVAAMLAAGRINVRRLTEARGASNSLMLIVLLSLGLVALSLIPGVGKSVNGAQRWLYAGPKEWGLTFQPSELVKWVTVVAVAWWCARRQGLMGQPRGFVPPLLLIGCASGLVLIEDLGTAALIGLVGGCMLLAGGARLWHLGLAIPPAVGAFAVAMVHHPYRLRRVTAFLDPWADPSGAGYHPIQSMLAIAQGGITGRGLGNGIQKFGYLPENTTDFIFAVICEETGLTGAALVVGLFLTILWVSLGIVRDSRDTFSQLMGLGVILTIGLQAAINLAVVTVVVPTKGIALPLISRGGTGWILTAFALGLVAALDKANKLQVPALENRFGDDPKPGTRRLVQFPDVR